MTNEQREAMEAAYKANTISDSEKDAAHVRLRDTILMGGPDVIGTLLHDSWASGYIVALERECEWRKINDIEFASTCGKFDFRHGYYCEYCGGKVVEVKGE